MLDEIVILLLLPKRVLSFVGGVVVLRWLFKHPKAKALTAAFVEQREMLQLHDDVPRRVGAWFARKTTTPTVRATFQKLGCGTIAISADAALTEEQARAALTLVRSQKGFAWPKAGATLDIDMTTALPITTLR